MYECFNIIYLILKTNILNGKKWEQKLLKNCRTSAFELLTNSSIRDPTDWIWKYTGVVGVPTILLLHPSNCLAGQNRLSWTTVHILWTSWSINTVLPSFYPAQCYLHDFNNIKHLWSTGMKMASVTAEHTPNLMIT